MAQCTDSLHNEGLQFEFWLNVEAFEFLRDDPCLPVDVAGSGMSEILDRTSKSRIDWALTVAGSRSNKIISFAWDSDWTCTTANYPISLSDEVSNDFSRPILSQCGWNTANDSHINVLGYNLDAKGLLFKVGSNRAFAVIQMCCTCTVYSLCLHVVDIYPVYIS